jgi:hypothetical protein
MATALTLARCVTTLSVSIPSDSGLAPPCDVTLAKSLDVVTGRKPQIRASHINQILEHLKGDRQRQLQAITTRSRSLIYLMRVNVKLPTGSLVNQSDLESE